ncbi:hypothetical protein [Pseudanabaena sp. PCC 6802]|uniref:hypothetical protein n=1 Tax=Pseudanabaena sp. PCC 6802 TaxID=118173 RepID=UPI0003499E08|nr:hypothetical protein [Pseudanabaena sp. PCC 6802]
MDDLTNTSNDVSGLPIPTSMGSGLPTGDPSSLDTLLIANRNGSSGSGAGSILYYQAGDDVITVDDLSYTIYAGEGNNVVTSSLGNDIIYAGSGRDIINAGDGRNGIDAGAGNNIITSGVGKDLIFAGIGNDVIYAGDGKNTIYAGDGNNRILTGKGNDYVSTGGGNDVIYTGRGNDTIAAGNGNNIISAGNGEDSVTVGSGIDRIILEAGSGSVTVTGFNASSDNLYLGSSLLGRSLAFTTQNGNTLVKAGNDLLAKLKGVSVGSEVLVTGTLPYRYEAIDLGALNTNAKNVRANTINDLGQISGRSETGQTQTVGTRTFNLSQGFIWQNGAIAPLPSTGLKVGGSNDGQTITLPGAGGFVNGINDRSVLVGAADEILGQSTDRATRWEPESGGYSLEITDFGGVESYFFDINNQNRIAGRHIYGPGSTPTASNRSSPIYWEDGEIVNLEDLDGDTGTARGINSKGQIVGQIDRDGINDLTINTAALWQEVGGEYNLTDLGTFGAEQSVARDINDVGQIIGWTSNGTGSLATSSPFLWQNGIKIDLGSFGGSRGETSGINQFGQVVGFSQNASGQDAAFIWQNGIMFDLNNLVTARPTFNSGNVTLIRANAINNFGDVAAYGTFTYQDATGTTQTGTRSYLLRTVI